MGHIGTETREEDATEYSNRRLAVFGIIAMSNRCFSALAYTTLDGLRVIFFLFNITFILLVDFFNRVSILYRF